MSALRRAEIIVLLLRIIRLVTHATHRLVGGAEPQTGRRTTSVVTKNATQSPQYTSVAFVTALRRAAIIVQRLCNIRLMTHAPQPPAGRGLS